MLHSRIAEEAGQFTIADVIANLSEKMIRRHPHVFSDVSVEDSAEVVRNWDAIKAEERGDRPVSKSVLDGIPREYPALMKAMEVSKRAVKVGFEWEHIDHVWDKVHEELDELREATQSGDKNEIRGEMGDLLFTLVNISRWMKVDAEESLRQMLDRFTNRFRYMETRLAEQGRPMEEVPLAELDALWDEAKASLKRSK
jgi:tetrapyrrole methylase family protein/MazG family protein